jgi:hypothetical protein
MIRNITTQNVDDDLISSRDLVLRGESKPFIEINQNDGRINLFFVVFWARRAMPKTQPDALNSWIIYAIDY